MRVAPVAVDLLDFRERLRRVVAVEYAETLLDDVAVVQELLIVFVGGYPHFACVYRGVREPGRRIGGGVAPTDVFPGDACTRALLVGARHEQGRGGVVLEIPLRDVGPGRPVVHVAQCVDGLVPVGEAEQRTLLGGA